MKEARVRLNVDAVNELIKKNLEITRVGLQKK